MSKSKARKIHVDGVDYLWTIAKKVVKIRNTVTNHIDRPTREQVGYTYSHRGDNGVEIRAIITPKMIADFIKNGKRGPASEYFPNCGHSDVPQSVNCVPFDLEIYEKIVWVYWCEDCFDRNAEDI